MALRFYSSTAPDTALNGSIDDATQTLNVDSVAGYPTSFPFTISAAPGSSSEELMDVTNATGTTLTVVRGVDGTVPLSHTSGTVIRHVASARDFREANSHVNTGINVHDVGPGSSVVGTATSQVLTNKTVSNGELSGVTTVSGTMSGGTYTGATLTQPTIADFTSAQHDHGDADDGGGLVNPTIAGAALSGTLTGDPTFSGKPVFTGGVLFTGIDNTFQGSAAGDNVLRATVSGDVNSRLIVEANGRHVWGDGVAPQDTNLYRSAANRLKTDDDFVVGGDATVSGSLTVDSVVVPKILTAVKTADEAYSSTTLQDDDHLAVPIEASSRYAVQMHLRVTQTSTTPDFKFNFTVGGSGGEFQGQAVTTQGSSGGAADVRDMEAGNDVAVPTEVGTSSVTFTGRLITGASNSGDFQLQWAQNTNHTSDTVLQNGSWLMLTKLD